MNTTTMFILGIVLLGIIPFLAAVAICAAPFVFLGYVWYITLKFVRVRKLDKYKYGND